MRLTRIQGMTFGLLLGGLAAQAQGAPAASETPIKKVLVLSDRAQVTREAKVPCTDGAATARFFPLPATVQLESVHAQGAGQTRAVGTAQRQRTLDEAIDPRAEALKTEIIALDDEIMALSRQLQRLDARHNLSSQYSDRIVDAINGRMLDPNGNWDVPEWGRNLDQLQAEHTGRTQAILDVQRTLREKQRVLDRKQQALGRLQNGAGRTALEVEVSASCKGPQARVQLSYIVSGAQWKPEYDLRFVPQSSGSSKGTVELTVGAIIQQRTGEDWEDAQIILSSARPRLGGEAPKPARLNVTGNKGSKDKVLVQARERREKLDAGNTPTDAPSGATLDDKGQSVTLTLPRRISVAADGRPYWVPVDLRKTKGEQFLSVIPKLSHRVWRKVRFKNPAPYPLMAGLTHVFRGGDYVGDTSIRHRGPGAPIEVALGVDEGFKVERKAANEQTRKPGMFQSAKKMERAYEIIIERKARGSAKLEITENLPLSRVDKVKVDLDKKGTTPGYSIDKDRGFITWPLKLKANEKETISLSYTIRLPDDWKVQ
ncbi:MAG: mucoidy inhibitor MuiA family protein [Bradymonadia bacterium]